MINVQEVLEQAGAHADAPEGSQAWALAQVADAFDAAIAALSDIATTRLPGGGSPAAASMKEIARQALAKAGAA